MNIKVQAPNRIDLAGGTTDIYPLYLFMEGGFTINAGLGIYSVVNIMTAQNGSNRIESLDLKETIEFDDPETLLFHGPLGLISRAFHTLPPPSPIELRTENRSPKGSGLGASSALTVALVKGLSLLRGEDPTESEMVELACEIETASITTPTGKQDYIAAVSGGVSLIDFHIGGYSRLELAGDKNPEDLEDHIVLSHTGESRFSGMNNWEITKAFIDNQGSVREKLLNIRDIAVTMKDALIRGDWKEVAELLDQEWKIRKTLAHGISTDQVERIMDAAKEAGAWASKICGAGGGGCMITMTEPGLKAFVKDAIVDSGGRVLPMEFDYNGVQTWVYPE